MSLVSLSSCFQHVHVWVFFLPFLLTSLLFFLSCFLEPWWRRSKEAEAQLRLPPRRSWYKLQWKRKKTKKKVLKLSRIYQLRHPLPYYYFYFIFFCLHGCHGLTDLCPQKYYLNWQSWIWFLETHQSLESVGQLQQIIIIKKKKKWKRLTEGSKSQMLKSARCGGRMDRNKCTKMPSWTKMHGQRGVRI